MSNFLCDMKEGDETNCQGPFGDFILRPPLRDTIFVATGTGIAPFRSILHWLLADTARHQDKQFWLVFGNRTEKDIYYHAEFLSLASQHANFHYLPTLSRGNPGLAGLARIRAGARACARAGPNGHARLHLWTGQDDQSQPRSFEKPGVGSEINPLREVRLGRQQRCPVTPIRPGVECPRLTAAPLFRP